MGANNSSHNYPKSAKDRHHRSRHSLRSSRRSASAQPPPEFGPPYISSVDLGRPERPLYVPEALFDRALLSRRKRKWLESEHSWDKCSDNICVNEDRTSFVRLPVAQRTDVARGKLRMEHGVHIWKLKWSAKMRGTHAVIGVCDEDLPLTTTGYTQLLGSTKKSWGWDIKSGGLFHGGKKSNFTFPTCVTMAPEDIPEVIIMIVDMDAGTLAFEVDNVYLGVAFSDLNGSALYVAVSAVWGNCKVEMIYMNAFAPGEVRPLVTLARNSVRQAMGATRIEEGYVEHLRLPPILKLYVGCMMPPVSDSMDDVAPLDRENNVSSKKEMLETVSSSADGHEDPILPAVQHEPYSSTDLRPQLQSTCVRAAAAAGVAMSIDKKAKLTASSAAASSAGRSLIAVVARRQPVPLPARSDVSRQSTRSIDSDCPTTGLSPNISEMSLHSHPPPITHSISVSPSTAEPTSDAFDGDTDHLLVRPADPCAARLQMLTPEDQECPRNHYKPIRPVTAKHEEVLAPAPPLRPVSQKALLISAKHEEVIQPVSQKALSLQISAKHEEVIESSPLPMVVSEMSPLLQNSPLHRFDLGSEADTDRVHKAGLTQSLPLDTVADEVSSKASSRSRMSRHRGGTAPARLPAQVGSRKVGMS